MKYGLIISSMIIFAFSCWNLVCSGTVLVCFILNRKNAWTQYAINLQHITFNMCFMGIVFAVMALSFLLSSSELRRTTCVTLLHFQMISFLQHSFQSMYVCIQRTCVILKAPLNMYPRYSNRQKRIIFAVNTCIYIACGIFVFSYFSQQTMNSKLQFQYCTFNVYTQSERVMFGIAFVMNAPYFANFILYGVVWYQHVKQARHSVVPLNILHQRNEKDISRTDKVELPFSQGNKPTLQQSSNDQGHIRSLYAKQVLPSNSKGGPKESTEHNIPGQVPENKNDISVISGKRYEAEPAKTVSNKFVIKTKARALREMGITLVLDAVMPLLLLIVCMFGSVFDNSVLEVLRALALLLTYTMFCLKTAIMVYRYDILRKALLKMLRKCLCQQRN